MAEFKIDGRMTVRTLKENFKKEFEGTLRVYNGRELADESATLAAIRTGDAKGGELVCRASRTVGKFEQEMMEVFGIKVQVASPDDWVLVLDGVTLANLKNIPKQARKADMESLVAYKRKVSQIESDSNNEVKDMSGKVLLDSKYKYIPFIDFKFNKIDWELNEDNIEAHREDIDGFGVVYIKAGEDDFDVIVFADCDIADGLYDAMEEVENFINDGYDTVEVYYTSVCEFYGEGESEDYGNEFGHVLSSLAFCEDNNYDYNLNSPVLCRAIWDDRVQVWLTDEWGDHEDELELNNEINLLIEYKKDPNGVADKIEWKEPIVQCFNGKGEHLFEAKGDFVPVWMNSSGLIYVELGKKYGILNIQGKEVQPCKYDDVFGFLSNGWTVVQCGTKYSLINERGEEALPFKYDAVNFFASNGLARVWRDRKYGFINNQGEEVIPCQFDDVSNFTSNGLARVKIGGKYGFINNQGEEVIPCQFDNVDDFTSNGGLAIVKVDKKYGFINEKGEEIVPCKYEQVFDVPSNEFILVKLGKYWGGVNNKGEEIIPCKYDYISHVSTNGLVRVKVDGEIRFVNALGEEVIFCEYDSVDNFSSCGLARVKIDGKYGFINDKGEEVLPCQFENVNNFSLNGLAKVKIGGKYGFINTKGEEVIPCKYDEVSDFSVSGLASIKIGTLYGCINLKGEEVLPCSYSEVNILEDLIFVKNK